jgi:hypothetical protein
MSEYHCRKDVDRPRSCQHPIETASRHKIHVCHLVLRDQLPEAQYGMNVMRQHTSVCALSIGVYFVLGKVNARTLSLEEKNGQGVY